MSVARVQALQNEIEGLKDYFIKQKRAFLFANGRDLTSKDIEEDAQLCMVLFFSVRKVSENAA